MVTLGPDVRRAPYRRHAAPACAIVAIGVLTLGWQARTTITVKYRAASEDDSSTGQILVEAAPGTIGRASVWETECAVRARANVDVPGADVEQFWSIHAEVEKDAKGRSVVRLRYRLVTADGPGPWRERAILPDGKDTLFVEALSARTGCRYDRIYVTISAGSTGLAARNTRLSIAGVSRPVCVFCRLGW